MNGRAPCRGEIASGQRGIGGAPGDPESEPPQSRCRQIRLCGDVLQTQEIAKDLFRDFFVMKRHESSVNRATDEHRTTQML